LLRACKAGNLSCRQGNRPCDAPLGGYLLHCRASRNSGLENVAIADQAATSVYKL